MKRKLILALGLLIAILAVIGLTRSYMINAGSWGRGGGWGGGAMWGTGVALGVGFGPGWGYYGAGYYGYPYGGGYYRRPIYRRPVVVQRVVERPVYIQEQEPYEQEQANVIVHVTNHEKENITIFSDISERMLRPGETKDLERSPDNCTLVIHWHTSNKDQSVKNCSNIFTVGNPS